MAGVLRNLSRGPGSDAPPFASGTPAIMLRAVALFAALALSLSAHAQQVIRNPAPAPTALDQQLAKVSDTATLLNLAMRHQAESDWASQAAVWRRLIELRPHIGDYRYQLAAAYAQQDLKSQTYTTLLELQAQGYGYDLTQDKRFAPVATTPVWHHIADVLKQSTQPFGEGKVAYTLPKEDLLIESLAWDPSRKALLVGSIREGAVYQVGGNGKLVPLLRADEDNGLWAVMDLAVDAKRGVLWVASTAVPHFKGYAPEKDLGQAGVFKFDLKTGKFLKRYLSPSVLGQQFFISTLALAGDGTVYAADGVNNAVYMVRDDQFKRVFHATTLTGIRGMTLDAGDRILYFADVERGIFGYDLNAGQPFDVLVPENLALAGIDGLLWWNNHLLAVQGGMSPPRVMRLTLGEDGRRFIGAQPLEAAQPALTEPTLATLADDGTLYFIANSQKQLYDRFGLPKKRDALQGTRIYSLQADFALEKAEAAQPAQP